MVSVHKKKREIKAKERQGNERRNGCAGKQMQKVVGQKKKRRPFRGTMLICPSW